MTNSVERTYAKALLEMAQEARRTGNVGEEMVQIGGLLEDQPGLRGLLGSRVLSTGDRAKSIETIFKSRVSDLVYRFIQVVNLKGRLDLLPGIAVAYGEALDEHNGVIEAEAYVAVPLSSEQERQVSDRISGMVSANVVLRQIVDPKLIGGVRIRVGDLLIDGTVSTQLKMMRQSLAEAGRQKAKSELGKLLTES